MFLARGVSRHSFSRALIRSTHEFKTLCNSPGEGRNRRGRKMDDLRRTVESLFRRESGRIIASLIRVSGSFDLAEEAMQEAFTSALARWPAKGIPDNPPAWIM